MADWGGLKYPPMSWLQLGSQVGVHLIQWVYRVGWMLGTAVLGTKWGGVQLGSALLLARGCNDISEERGGGGAHGTICRESDNHHLKTVVITTPSHSCHDAHNVVVYNMCLFEVSRLSCDENLTIEDNYHHRHKDYCVG